MDSTLEGVAVRTGHHCCQPVMDRMKISSPPRGLPSPCTTPARTSTALVQGLQGIVAGGLRRKARGAEGSVEALPAVRFGIPGACCRSSSQSRRRYLAEDFEMLDDRNERNQYVLDLAAACLILSRC